MLPFTRNWALGMVNAVLVVTSGLASLPFSHTRYVSLATSPSTSVALQATLTEANVVSVGNGFCVSFTVGAWLLNSNVCRGGCGSRAPALSMARTENTGFVYPEGASTVNSESVFAVKCHTVSAGATGFFICHSKPLTAPSTSEPNQYRCTTWFTVSMAPFTNSTVCGGWFACCVPVSLRVSPQPAVTPRPATADSSPRSRRTRLTGAPRGPTSRSGPCRPAAWSWHGPRPTTGRGRSRPPGRAV